MKNKKQIEKNFIVFLSLFILSFVLIGLDKWRKLEWLKRPEEVLTNPIKKRIYTFKLKLAKKKIKEKTALELKKKAESAAQENSVLKVKIDNLEKENTAMRKLLGAPLPAVWKFIPAQVLSVKNGSIIIDKGRDDGLKENQIAVFKNILVGRIIKVNPHLSKIKLPLAKDINIKAKVIETNGRGTIRSKAGEVLILDKILPEVRLVTGQIVVTSGEDETYPSDLLVGKISEVEKDETAIYQKAIIKPLVDYKNLTEVFVVKR